MHTFIDGFRLVVGKHLVVFRVQIQWHTVGNGDDKTRHHHRHEGQQATRYHPGRKRIQVDLGKSQDVGESAADSVQERRRCVVLALAFLVETKNSALRIQYIRIITPSLKHHDRRIAQAGIVLRITNAIGKEREREIQQTAK